MKRHFYGKYGYISKQGLCRHSERIDELEDMDNYYDGTLVKLLLSAISSFTRGRTSRDSKPKRQSQRSSPVKRFIGI